MMRASWLFTARIAQLVMSFVGGAFVAKTYGPEQYGTLTYGLSAAFLIMLLSNLGLDSVVVRRVSQAETPGAASETILMAFMSKFAVSLCTLILCIAFLRFVVSVEYQLLLIISIVSFSFVVQSFSVIEMYFQANLKTKIIAFGIIFSSLISLVVKLFLAINTFDIWMISLATLAEFSTTAAVLMFFFFRESGSYIRKIPPLEKFKSLLSESLPLLLSILAVSIYMKVDQVMVFNLLGAENAGYYGVATRISEAFFIIPTSICALSLPYLVNLRKVSPEAYSWFFELILFVMNIFALVLIVIIVFFGEQFITVIFGDSYSQSFSILMIQTVSCVFVFLGSGINALYVSEGWGKKIMYRSMFGCVLNVVLNYVCILWFGIIGAALATMVTQFTVNVLVDLPDRDVRWTVAPKLRCLLLVPALFQLSKDAHNLKEIGVDFR